jgi:GrpB-like predicted nucleotidyltransferase (UPF0157 family)/ribosomal protein S18 acetylase RimI-like enzyme
VTWPAQFQAEGARIEGQVGPELLGLEPFGSTAVPGLAGQPIVEVLLGVRDLEQGRRLVPALERLGYQSFDAALIPDRLHLRRRAEPPWSDVAITAFGSTFWSQSIAVRDYLRLHPGEVAAYGQDEHTAALGERARAWAWRSGSPVSPVMTVRRLRPADAATVRELRLEALGNDPDSFTSSFDEESPQPLQRTVTTLSAAPAERSVFGSFAPAAEPGARPRLIGMVGVSPMTKPKERHRGGIWAMYVRPEARGAGHAWRLLTAAIARARTDGLTQLELSVAVTATRARDLYLQLGFQIYGRLPRAMRTASGFLDEDLLVMRLTP